MSIWAQGKQVHWIKVKLKAAWLTRSSRSWNFHNCRLRLPKPHRLTTNLPLPPIKDLIRRYRKDLFCLRCSPSRFTTGKARKLSLFEFHRARQIEIGIKIWYLSARNILAWQYWKNESNESNILLFLQNIFIFFLLCFWFSTIINFVHYLHHFLMSVKLIS